MVPIIDLEQRKIMNNTQTIEQTLRAYILENFLFTSDPGALKSNDSFLQKGILDSTSVLELAEFIERELHVKVPDEEMIPENLDSVDRIVAYVQRKGA